jgi:peptidoglycan/xylan/chitin deacetylase (PgdA/CDA1 family)
MQRFTLDKRLRFVVLACIALAVPSQALVVLQYHQVAADGPSSTSVSPKRFEEHLQLIESLGLHVMDLEEAIKQIQAGNTLEGAVAITFDDGYASIYEQAFPLLKKRSWPFTLFLSTNPIDQRFGDMLTWDQIREMAKADALIVNHTQDHGNLARPPLTNQPSYQKRVLDNLNHAQMRIEKELGKKVPKYFAYPYGEYNLDLLKLLKSEGWIAFGQHSGPVGPTSDWQALPRFPASGVYSNPITLKTKLTSLAFQVLNESPISPKPSSNYRLEVTTDNINPDSFQCFFAGKPIEIDTQVETSQLKVTVPLNSLIPKGRSRINCTARHNNENRFFWHSKFWLNLDAAETLVQD